MYDLRYSAKRFADTGMLLCAVRAVLSFLLCLFPELVSRPAQAEITRAMSLNPINHLGSIISLALYVLLYFALRNDLAAGSRGADTLLVLTIIYTAGMPVLSAFLNYTVLLFINRMYSAEQIAGRSMLGVPLNLIGLISALSVPLLLAAAALNNAYRKQNPQ